MSEQFQFDTSGEVAPTLSNPAPRLSRGMWHWPDLSPGVQGCIAGMLEEMPWYSAPQIEEMKSLEGMLPCKCGNFPTPSDDNCHPDDGWRSLWCQSCLEHVTEWKPSEGEAVRDWNTKRTRELSRPFGFRDLHPDTLARIIADHDQWQRVVGPPILDTAGTDVFFTVERGRRFWAERQAGQKGENFPPLTPHLDDAGKVCVREAGQ